jgi:nitrate reductase gamma subunit
MEGFEMEILNVLAGSIPGIFFLIATISGGLLYVYMNKKSEEITKVRIKEAENKVEKEPEKSKPAWDLARVTLESYFNKNLTQVSAIFWLSVLVMFIGFGIIVWGITQAISVPNSTLPAVITGSAGVITELIGATFLFIYRSTMEQAVNYTKTLERINSVGMAMQILDTIPEDAKDDCLKNSTKATVVKMLMKQAYEIDGVQNSVEAAGNNRTS